MGVAENIVEGVAAVGPTGLKQFAAGLEPEWLTQALEATGKASMRRRKLPAEMVVWLVLGMAMFRDRSIVAVVDHLGLLVEGVTSLANSAVPKARYRLGAEPMEWLFRHSSRVWQKRENAPTWRGLTLYAVDGCCARVQDSDKNFQHFGKPGGRGGTNDAGYPQLRMACLLNLGTRMVVDAAFGPYATSEQELALRLWPQLTDFSVTILDRGFVSFALFYHLQNSGTARHLMVRMRQDLKYEVIQELPDGTLLARLTSYPALKRQYPDMATKIVGRIVGYQHPDGAPSKLFVTLLDPEKYPAEELVRLYHERWEVELAFDEVKTHMLERTEAHFRSTRPEGVEQEVWGALLLYNLARLEMLRVARKKQVEPKRISFRNSLLWMRTFWLTTAWLTTPGALPRALTDFESTLDVLLLPERRTDRRYPRHVKIKMSKYARNRGTRSLEVTEGKEQVLK